MIFRGFTFALRPTPEQTEKFGQIAGVCRLVWNLALEQRRSHWRNYQARTGNNLKNMAASSAATACGAIRSGVGLAAKTKRIAAKQEPKHGIFVHV